MAPCLEHGSQDLDVDHHTHARCKDKGSSPIQQPFPLLSDVTVAALTQVSNGSDVLAVVIANAFPGTKDADVKKVFKGLRHHLFGGVGWMCVGGHICKRVLSRRWEGNKLHEVKKAKRLSIATKDAVNKHLLGTSVFGFPICTRYLYAQLWKDLETSLSMPHLHQQGMHSLSILTISRAGLQDLF